MKSKTGRERVSRLPETVALVAVALVLAWQAGTSLYRQVESVDLYRAGRALERGHDVGLEALQRRSGDLDRLVAERRCDDLGLRAGVALSFAEIERRDPVLDFDGWAAAIDRSRQLLRVAIACSPQRSMFWARLAVVERLIASSPVRVMPLAAMSARLAPAELGVIRTRFRIWRHASRWFPTGVAAPLVSDMRTILNEAQLPDIRRMLGGSRFLKRYALSELPRMSVDRQAEIGRLHLDREPSPAEADRPRFDLLDTPRR